MTKKIYFYTFGCKVNQYDTQHIRENFTSQGFTEVFSPEAADIIVINSCTVTAEADRQCRQIIRRMLRSNPSADVVVCGCYPKRAAEELEKNFASSCRVKIHKSAKDVLDYYALGEKQKHITSFSERSRAYLKIQDGCDQYCRYCVVPLVRSGNYSKPSREVLAEVKTLVANGYLEIVLCGVRLGRYNPEKNYLLEDLIVDILKTGSGFRLRLSSIEITEITDRLLKIMSENPDRICHHLHIPLQSGDDTILKKMNRPYTTDYFSNRLAEIRKMLPDVAVTTDVIIGFPGETEKSFENTCDFVLKNGFAKLHIFPFSPRPGTAAAKLKHLVNENEYTQKVKCWKKKLFEIDAALQKRARKISESRPHRAIPIGDGWILTEDYQYYKLACPPKNEIFDFVP